MPNWCENSLYISHEDSKMIEKLTTAWDQNKFFGTIFPEPDYNKVKVKPMFPEIKGNNDPVSPESAWWDWRVRNWGTKWEIASNDYEKPTVDSDGKSMKVYFSTAWSPPTGIYDRLSNDGYSVDAYYYEGGCAFCGRYVDGYDETYEIQSNWEWVQNNIPESIDLEFAISENMKEWAMQELYDEIESLKEDVENDPDNAELKSELQTKQQKLEELENA